MATSRGFTTPRPAGAPPPSPPPSPADGEHALTRATRGYRVVWTGSSRQGAIVAGRSVQSVFYGQLSLIDGANGGGGALGAAPPDFAEQQKSLLAKQPVWLLHGCWVSENSLTGAPPTPHPVTQDAVSVPTPASCPV